jgi:Na+-transporting NADH:ubiquinone oxidoreductase subunit NqrC
MVQEEIIRKRGKSIPLRTPLSQEIKKSIFMLIFTLLAIIVLVSIVYLLNSSQTTQKGYSLKQQQLEKDQLMEKSRDLVRQIIQAQSFTNIENNQLVKQMVKPEKPVYLDIPAAK